MSLSLFAWKWCVQMELCGMVERCSVTPCISVCTDGVVWHGGATSVSVAGASRVL